MLQDQGTDMVVAVDTAAVAAVAADLDQASL